MPSEALSRKPSTSIAMLQLIEEARSQIPFNTPSAELCAGPCRGCPKKLLEFLDSELEDWQELLGQDQQPSLGDVQKLAKRCRKIYRSLEVNGLISQ
jgi:hypothetical protein